MVDGLPSFSALEPKTKKRDGKKLQLSELHCPLSRPAGLGCGQQDSTWLTFITPFPAVSSHHSTAAQTHTTGLNCVCCWSWVIPEDRKGWAVGGEVPTVGPSKVPERETTKWHPFQGAFTFSSPRSHANSDDFSGIEQPALTSTTWIKALPPTWHSPAKLGQSPPRSLLPKRSRQSSHF